MRKIVFLIVLTFFISCKEETLPKPQGYLSLVYEDADYQKLQLERPYVFQVSKRATVKNEPNNWLKINYPAQKASLDITYRPIKNNLKELLIEAEKLVYKHTVKAENILSINYENSKRKVFGAIQDITGNSASHLQFHLTDSVNHFIKGALYFNSRPNYDSVLPAVEFIKKDIEKLFETIEWVD